MVDLLGGAVFLELDDGRRCREVAIRLHEVLWMLRRVALWAQMVEQRTNSEV